MSSDTVERRDPSGYIYLAGLGLILVALFLLWAAHHKLAAAVIVGGVLWIAGIVGGICAANMWIEERKARADADDRCEALEAALEDALRDAETAPVPLVPVEVVEKPDLRIVQPDDPGPEWPRLAEQIEREATPVNDDLAVETFMEQIERWGSDVER